jgi:replicative DNA helicase
MSTKTNEGVSDVTTERFVLSGLCQYGKNAYIDTEGVINSDIFYDEKNQALYKVISHVLESNDKVK